MSLEFHPSTAHDVNDALAYYGRQRAGLASQFRWEIDAALARISRNALAFPVVEGDVRRCVLHRFPYSILFRVRDRKTIRVLVIRHHKRHPRFGLRRK